MTQSAHQTSKPDTHYLELRILGTILDTGKIPDLEKSDFQDQDLAILFDLIRSSYRDDEAFDFVIVGEQILRTTGLDKREWLREIWDHRISSPPLFESYCMSLRKHRDKDKVVDTLSEAYHDARDADDPADAQDRAVEALRQISVRKRSVTSSIQQLVEQSMQELDRLKALRQEPGVKTGFPSLDAKTGGWQKSDLTLLAARPGVGKTALACNMVLAAAGKKIGFVSTEQPGIQITNRLLAIAGEIDAWKLRNPKMFQAHEWERKLPKAIKIVDALELQVMDNTKPSVAEIEREFRDADLDLLIVDYAQRLKASGEIYERISSIAHGLKDLARNFDVPVVALAQINRQGAKNAGLEHLKGSGDLEQEADAVLMLECEDMSRSATLTLQKNRHGPTGSIPLIFEREILRFREAAK